MPLKRIALTLIVAGIVCLLIAPENHRKAGYEDGSFLYAIGLYGGGTIMFVLGVLFMLFDLFMVA